MNRVAALARLSTETFDVCIIGGGATGAGCALDGQLRGLKVALIEGEDFAAGTSGKSTKLVHGGVRYLEQAVKKLDWEQFRLVRKALKERSTMLNNAPYLAHPLALLTPCYHWWEGLYYATGLKLYDWIAGKANLSSSRWLSRTETLRQIPTLTSHRLRGAVLYWDGQFDDARYNVVLAKTAAEAGATVANHLRVMAFEHDPDGKLQAITVEDALSGHCFEVRARVFVNATGPAADHLRQLANPKLPPRVRVSKGAHVVLPRESLPGQTALLIPKTDDGRVIFALPWLNQLLVGTTDTEVPATGGDKDFTATALLGEEVTYLLHYLNRYLAVPVRPEQVQSGFAGLRPLLQADPGATTGALVRDHEVEVDAASGLVSIMGGKWTTYRLMAHDTLEVVCAALQRSQGSSATVHHPLSGAVGYTAEGWRVLADAYALSAETSQHLWRHYGTHAYVVAELAREQPDWTAPLTEGHPHLSAEVVYAVRHEMALTIRDVLARRLGLERVDWQAARRAAPATAKLMGQELGWSDARVAQEVAGYAEILRQYQQCAAG